MGTAQHRRLRWIMLAPALAFVGLMIVFPLLFTAHLSFSDAFGAVNADTSWAGTRNYTDALSDDKRFWPALWRTVLFTVVAVAVETVLGLALAMLMRKPFRGVRVSGRQRLAGEARSAARNERSEHRRSKSLTRWAANRRAKARPMNLMRTVLIIPLLATPVAIGVLWLLVLDPTIGIANHVLTAIGLPPQEFLGSVSQSLPTLMLIDIWQWTPMMTIILLAGLSTLPTDPEEAATVDGAGPWQRFRHVVLPMLGPTLASALVLRSVDALKTFDIIYATKGAGGGSSFEAETLNVFAYGLTFDYQEYALASAVLVLFTALIVGVVLLLRRGVGRDAT